MSNVRGEDQRKIMSAKTRFWGLVIAAAHDLDLCCSVHCCSIFSNYRKTDMFIAVFFRNLTLAGVRRLLEEDLGLDKNALDPFKKFISRQIDMVGTIFSYNLISQNHCLTFFIFWLKLYYMTLLLYRF